VVQYFTDMAGIERLAAALFEEQRRRADDSALAALFESFVVDEARHAEVALRQTRSPRSPHSWKTMSPLALSEPQASGRSERSERG